MLERIEKCLQALLSEEEKQHRHRWSPGPVSVSSASGPATKSFRPQSLPNSCREIAAAARVDSRLSV
jgi:hypothetical protein